LGYLPDPEWIEQMGLVGYWPLNEGSGTKINDYSGNSNFGVFSGQSTPQTQWGSGDKGIALQFNSSNTQQVDFGQPASLMVTGAITYGVRCYLAAAFSTGFQNCIGRWSNGAGRAFWLGLSSAAGVSANAVSFVSDSLGVVGSAISSQSQSYFIGGWHDLIATWTPTTMTVSIYVDGLLSGTGPANFVAGLGNGALDTIVSGQNGGGANWNGGLDRPFVANQAWSANQILKYCSEPWSGWLPPNTRRWFGGAIISASPPPPTAPQRLPLLGVG